MDLVKIVVRFGDGRTLKGYTQDFFPNKTLFHIYPSDSIRAKDATEVQVKDLKAVFFVRDFAGDSDYRERKQYADGDKPTGRMVEVTFKDGEVIAGSTLGYEPKRPGFFLFPADPQGNNLRVFVVSIAVNTVRYM